jgi:hypothetical protein
VVPSKVALATRNMNRYEQCLDLGSRPFRCKACDGPCHVAPLRRLFSRVLEILCIAVHRCAAGAFGRSRARVGGGMAHMAVKSQKRLRMNLAELQDPSAARVKQCLLGWR